MGREPFLRRCRSTFPCTTLTCAGVSGITWYFYQLSPSEGYVTHVLLTSPPFSGKQASPAIRLACLRRAASVRSEPGSNSPWLFISPKADDFHFSSNPFSSWKEPAAYFLFPYLYAASCVYSPKKTLSFRLPFRFDFRHPSKRISCWPYSFFSFPDCSFQISFTRLLTSEWYDYIIFSLSFSSTFWEKK